MVFGYGVFSVQEGRKIYPVEERDGKFYVDGEVVNTVFTVNVSLNIQEVYGSDVTPRALFGGMLEKILSGKLGKKFSGLRLSDVNGYRIKLFNRGSFASAFLLNDDFVGEFDRFHVNFDLIKYESLDSKAL